MAIESLELMEQQPHLAETAVEVMEPSEINALDLLELFSGEEFSGAQRVFAEHALMGQKIRLEDLRRDEFAILSLTKDDYAEFINHLPELKNSIVDSLATVGVVSGWRREEKRRKIAYELVLGSKPAPEELPSISPTRPERLTKAQKLAHKLAVKPRPRHERLGLPSPITELDNLDDTESQEAAARAHGDILDDPDKTEGPVSGYERLKQLYADSARAFATYILTGGDCAIEQLSRKDVRSVMIALSGVQELVDDQVRERYQRANMTLINADIDSPEQLLEKLVHGRTQIGRIRNSLKTPYRHPQAACLPLSEDTEYVVDHVESFFSEDRDSEEMLAAKFLCHTCVVIDECLSHALDNKIKEGVWGGLDEWQRKQIKRIKTLKGDEIAAQRIEKMRNQDRPSIEYWLELQSE